jgi:hypothetical protein
LRQGDATKEKREGRILGMFGVPRMQGDEADRMTKR